MIAMQLFQSHLEGHDQMIKALSNNLQILKDDKKDDKTSKKDKKQKKKKTKRKLKKNHKSIQMARGN